MCLHKKGHTSMNQVIVSLHLFVSRNVRLDTVTWKQNLFPMEIHKFVTPTVSRFPISVCSICYGSTGRKFLHWAEKFSAAQSDGGQLETTSKITGFLLPGPEPTRVDCNLKICISAILGSTQFSLLEKLYSQNRTKT